MDRLLQYTSAHHPDAIGNLTIDNVPQQDREFIHQMRFGDTLVLIDPQGEPEDLIPYYLVLDMTPTDNGAILKLRKL